MIQMKYFKTSCDKLIQFNPETGVYKLRNTIAKEDPRISKEDFDLLDSVQIKKPEFSRLMNVYFKDVKHEWEYQGQKFRKLPNFESSDYTLSTNYELGKQVPYHNIDQIPYYHHGLIAVYHWGKVYYHTISYNGYKQGQLICTRTFSLVRWAQLKHCAPVFNTSAKRIY